MNYRLNFKIYAESIVFKFINNRQVKIINKKLNLFYEIYTQMISNDWDILILNLKLLNSCLLDKLIKKQMKRSQLICLILKKCQMVKRKLFITNNDNL